MNKQITIKEIKQNIKEYQKIIDYHKIDLSKYKDDELILVHLENNNWNCEECNTSKNCINCEECAFCDGCKNCHRSTNSNNCNNCSDGNDIDGYDEDDD